MLAIPPQIIAVGLFSFSICEQLESGFYVSIEPTQLYASLPLYPRFGFALTLRLTDLGLSSPCFVTCLLKVTSLSHRTCQPRYRALTEGHYTHNMGRLTPIRRREGDKCYQSSRRIRSAEQTWIPICYLRGISSRQQHLLGLSPAIQKLFADSTCYLTSIKLSLSLEWKHWPWKRFLTSARQTAYFES